MDGKSLSDTASNQVRFHDLDALRAAAMLLGIVLHALLAHIPALHGIWPVTDVSSGPAWGTLMAAIHGFRMPLFFLLSGFFTAMLWRRRGLKSLIAHRAKRILVPLAIGTFTIVPAVWVVSSFAKAKEVASSTTEVTLWSLAATGDTQGLGELLTDDNLDALQPSTGATPLTLAALSRQVEAVDLLLERGADVNALNRDGATAAHGTFLFGHSAVAKRLIDAGADLTIRDGTGASAIAVLDADWGTTKFIADMILVPVEQTSLEEGRREIREYLASRQAADGNTVVLQDADEKRQDDLKALAGFLVFMLFYFPFFHHLWFLSFLLWLVLGFCLYVWIANRFIDVANANPTDAKPSTLRAWISAAVVSPFRYLWLIPLLMVPSFWMGSQGEGFGPDTSSGLLPLPHVLLYYAIFFGVGVLYFDAGDMESRLGSRWSATLPLALLIVFPLGLEMTTGQWGFRQSLLPESLYRVVGLVLQVAYAWLMTFGCIGVFRSMFFRESATLRYLSDSSYWLYLMHLPLIIFVQAYTGPIQLPAVVKILAVSLGVSAFLLVIYELGVRYTFIGTMLNGRKTRKPKSG